MVDGLRFGAALRTVRIRHGWRQADVAERAGVSAPTVSRIERGLVGTFSVDTLGRVARAVEIRLDLVPRWRGGELDRMLAAGHSAMHEAVARTLAGTPWLSAAEATFSVYGERGAIDVLAFHPPSGALLVIELKTQLVDVQQLIGSVDRYRRLAPVLAAARGWESRSTSSWVVLRDTPSNHRRLAAHATVLRAAFPHDGRRVRGWLMDPAGTLAALSFLSDVRAGNAMSASAGVARVRRASAGAGGDGEHRQRAGHTDSTGFPPAMQR